MYWNYTIWWPAITYLSDNSRQELFLEAIECDSKVDNVDLDVDSREIVGVGYRSRHVQPERTQETIIDSTEKLSQCYLLIWCLWYINLV